MMKIGDFIAPTPEFIGAEPHHAARAEATPHYGWRAFLVSGGQLKER